MVAFFFIFFIVPETKYVPHFAFWVEVSLTFMFKTTYPRRTRFCLWCSNEKTCPIPSRHMATIHHQTQLALAAKCKTGSAISNGRRWKLVKGLDSNFCQMFWTCCHISLISRIEMGGKVFFVSDSYFVLFYIVELSPRHGEC